MAHVYKTSDYDKFRTLLGNRNVDEGHVNKLIESMDHNDLSEQNPAIINEKLEIVDGQHRIAAWIKSARPIYYVIKEGATLDDVRLLNTTMKKWGMQDYVDSYVKQGNQNYFILDQLCKTYSLPISIGMRLLNKTMQDASSTIRLFKAGKFEVVSLKEAESMALTMVAYKPYTELGVWRSTDFLRAIIYLHENKLVVLKRMLKKLEMHESKLRRQASTREYLRVLEDIYNFKQKLDIVRFF